VEVTYDDIARIFMKGEYPEYEWKEYDPAEYSEERDPLGL